MTFVIVGASAGLGRALAEKFASEGHDLIVISSELKDLNAIKGDLQNRFDVKIFPIEMMFQKHALDFKEFDETIRLAGKISGVLLPIGHSDPTDNPYVNESKIYNIFNVNLVNVCIFINHCLEILKDTKLTITGFGSISAIRGRSRNSTYAAAKRGLESYFESLRHAEAESEITIQFYLLGYLKTNLTFGEQTVGPRPVEVDKLATEVFDNISKDFGMKFYPRVWIPLMMAFRFMPWGFFRRIKF